MAPRAERAKKKKKKDGGPSGEKTLSRAVQTQQVWMWLQENAIKPCFSNSVLLFQGQLTKFDVSELLNLLNIV